jgi:signal transduction histidine kinase
MRKSFLLIFLFLTTFLYSKTLEVGTEEFYKTKDYMLYALVEEINETPEELASKRWLKNKKTFNIPIHKNKAYWARLKLKNIASMPVTYYLKAENQFTYHIIYYLVKDGKVVERIEDGVIAKNSKREFNVNHMIFPLSLESGEEAEVFFKIQNYNKIDIDFTLATKDYLFDFYQTYNIIEGLFFGGMLMMMFYNLFLYFLLKFRAYLYYVFYTFWLTIYFAGLFGFSQRYFAGYTWIFYISSGAFFVSMTLFIQSILNLNEQLPVVNRVLNLFIGYFILSTLINILVLEFEQFSYAQILFNLSFIVVPFYVTLVIFITYYLAYLKKDSVAKIYSWVWTIVSFVGLLLPLVYLNIIETDIPSDYIFQFLILFEVLCFSFILAYKIKVIQKEQSEQQVLLVEQSKLASMGEMISTIAHQWRQPLSEINGVVLKMDIDYRKKKLTAEKFNDHLNDIEGITSYLSKTIHDFMNLFSHKKELEEFVLEDILKSSKRLASMFIKEEIEFSKINNINIKMVGYQSELIQALLIVMNNSIDAALSNNRLAVIKIDVKEINTNIHINIEDNGGGISEEVIKNIFNPYFTTKHESQGTGLGLYILKMIVEESMSGSVSICNKNKGVNCEIIIPKNLGKIRTF